MDVGLVELLRGDCVSATMMSTKKDIFGTWTEWHMCGDYRPINKYKHLDKYAMPLSKEIFDAFG
jgi:hypothetical protein